jgi:transcriptional regulator with XRE-family HTH domain
VWEKDMANRLRALRRRAGLSQPRLAEAAAVPLWSLRAWEQARRTPLFDAAVKIADALNISLDELAGRPTPKPKKKGGGR